MGSFGDATKARRTRNAKALAAFGVSASSSEADEHTRIVRQGNGITLFTIGYERRSASQLVDLLRDAGVTLLIDARDKPFSRRAEFRAKALGATCEQGGLRYESWPDLGSTPKQREYLYETHDIKGFCRKYRAYARRSKTEVIDRLAGVVERAKDKVALFCYERMHEDCHRGVIADLVADRINATVVAI